MNMHRSQSPALSLPTLCLTNSVFPSRSVSVTEKSCLHNTQTVLSGGGKIYILINTLNILNFDPAFVDKKMQRVELTLYNGLI